MYENGDALAEALLEMLTCDRRYLTPDKLAAAVSGRFDFFERYLSGFGPMETIDKEALIATISRSMALGFADKWRHPTGKEETTCPKKDC